MTPTDLKKGVIFCYQEEIYQSLDYKQKVLGRGRSQVSVKARRISDGKLWQHTFRGGEKLSSVNLNRRQVRFLYRGENRCHFMDIESFSQHVLSSKSLQEELPFLSEGQDCSLCLQEDQPLLLELPKNVWLKVTQASPVVKGDTSSDFTKEVTLITGLKVKVPPFIKEGDIISVSTEDGSYRERKK